MRIIRYDSHFPLALEGGTCVPILSGDAIGLRAVLSMFATTETLIIFPSPRRESCGPVRSREDFRECAASLRAVRRTPRACARGSYVALRCACPCENWKLRDQTCVGFCQLCG